MNHDGWDCHIHVFDARPTAGHYAPPISPTSALDATAAALGVRRFVLVQPSVYGSDNALLLESLRASGGRHRGVVVVDADIDEAALRAMHDAGVRGVRFNLLSPVGNVAPVDNGEAVFQRLAPTLRELGWHVQWHVKPTHLPMIHRLHEGTGVTAVLDHLAGFTARSEASGGDWDALRRIADQGGWIKASGLYRLESIAPFTDLDGLIAKAAALFAGRCVWASDWPHTFFHEPGRQQPVPAYDATWAPIPRALGAGPADAILRVNPALLYD